MHGYVPAGDGNRLDWDQPLSSDGLGNSVGRLADLNDLGGGRLNGGIVGSSDGGSVVGQGLFADSDDLGWDLDDLGGSVVDLSFLDLDCLRSSIVDLSSLDFGNFWGTIIDLSFPDEFRASVVRGYGLFLPYFDNLGNWQGCNWLRLLADLDQLDGLWQGCSRRDKDRLGSCQGQGLKEELPVLALAASDPDDPPGLVGLSLDDAGLGGGHVEGSEGQKKGQLLVRVR